MPIPSCSIHLSVPVQPKIVIPCKWDPDGRDSLPPLSWGRFIGDAYLNRAIGTTIGEALKPVCRVAGCEMDQVSYFQVKKAVEPGVVKVREKLIYPEFTISIPLLIVRLSPRGGSRV